MSRAPSKLSSLAHQKPIEAPAPASADGEVRGQTLRLNRPAWTQLKLISFSEGKSAHALLIEAVNDLFEKRGKPPIA